MKKRIFIFLILNLLLLTNCNKEEKKVEENKPEQTEVVTTENEAKTEEDINFKFSDKTYENLEKFMKTKEEVIEKLKTLSKEEADRLYDEYHEESIEFLQNIMLEEDFFKDSISEEKFEKANKIFSKYGLTVLELPGGYSLVAPSNFYYNIFKDYVSDEYQKYLEITSKYNDIDVVYMPSNLNPQEIEERIVTFKNFLDKYPNTRFEEISSVYVFYILDYINLSLEYKENEDGVDVPEDYYKISEENMKEYKQFIEKYPDDLASKCLEYLLENYKNKDRISIDEKIVKIIKKEMKEKYKITEIWNL